MKVFGNHPLPDGAYEDPLGGCRLIGIAAILALVVFGVIGYFYFT